MIITKLDPRFWFIYHSSMKRTYGKSLVDVKKHRIKSTAEYFQETPKETQNKTSGSAVNPSLSLVTNRDR